jgi:phenylacetate-CoA ligase
MLSALNMSSDSMAEYVNLINKKKPRVIVGYPSAMHMLAQFIRDKSLKLNGKLKGIVVTAEVLMPGQRETIESVFKAPVINEYGARDGGLIAYECPERNMHIVSENVFLEIDEDDSTNGKKMSGDLLITNLESYAYPFLRYRLGDQATLSTNKCACGRGLPLLRNILGRSTDWLIDKTGKKIHGLVVAHTIAKVQGIKHFQIIQEDLDHILINIVKNRFYKDQDSEFIVKSIGKYFSEDIDIHLEDVDEIPRSKSGKYRFVISKVEEVSPKR